MPSNRFVAGFAIMLLLGVAQLSAQTGPSLVLHFTGACDFVPTPSHSLVVIFPTSATMTPHQPFIRVAAAALLRASGLHSDQNGSLIAFNIQAGDRISIVGSSSAAIDPSAASFRQNVHVLNRSRDQATEDAAGQFVLTKGLLAALTGTKPWAFSRIGRMALATAPATYLAREVTVALTGPAAIQLIRAGTAYTISFNFTQTAPVNVMIANLPPDDIFYVGKPTDSCQDEHFLLHYALLGPNPSPAAPTEVPTSRGCTPSLVIADRYAQRMNQSVLPPSATTSGGTPRAVGGRTICFVMRWPK